MRAPDGAVAVVAITVPDIRPVEAPMPAWRRAVGVLVLVLATVATMVLSRLLATGVVGAATAEPIPVPPTVGSCVLIQPDRVEIVDCDRPHSGEIAKTWRAGTEPARTAFTLQDRPHFSVTRSLSTNGDALCAGWVQDYTGWSAYVDSRSTALWLAPQPLANGRLITAPDGQGLPDRHWSACVAQTSDVVYAGTLRNVSISEASLRPAGLSVCLDVSPTKVSFPECSRVHNAELLGSIALTQQMMFQRSVSIEYSDAEIHQQCVDLAGQRINRVDPTFGGQLEIITESVWAQSLSGKAPGPSSWLIPDCLVRLADRGRMVGSVVGLGEAPLPLDR